MSAAYVTDPTTRRIVAPVTRRINVREPKTATSAICVGPHRLRGSVLGILVSVHIKSVPVMLVSGMTPV
jgi:hypothetical protein